MLVAARRAGTHFDTRQIFEWVPGRAKRLTERPSRRARDDNSFL